MNSKPDEDKDTFETEVLSAQARAILHGLNISLLANAFIGATTATLLWDVYSNELVLIWVCFLLFVNILRLGISAYLRRSDLPDSKPEQTLRTLTGFAAFSGLTWACVPLFLTDFNLGGASAYIVFIICGISAGALIQSTAYAKTAIAFFLPQLIVVIIALFNTETMAGYVVSANAVLLTVMMVRSALVGEAQFVASVESALKAGRLARSLAVANDAIVATNRQLENLANHDVLTNLANRGYFNATLAERLQEGQKKGWTTALLVFDLDRFKAVNDTFGHSAGDQILVEFAQKLLERVRPGELAARLGGDEFAIVFTSKNAVDRAKAMAQEILAASLEPTKISGKELTTGSSIGVAFAPDHAEWPEELFKCADSALYEAKRRGRRCIHIFDFELKRRQERQRMIDESLADAIRGGQMRVEFQPQVRLLDSEPTGFEAFIRWDHPVLGLVAPQEITAAARNASIASSITTFVARQSCQFLKLLEMTGATNPTVSVNVSPTELNSNAIAHKLLKIVSGEGISPGRLELEITEESLLDAKMAKAGLSALEDAGFKLAVDDFGMGHSSLAYLLDQRIDRLKIDRNFIHGIAVTEKNQALVSALISMARSLSIEIVAEGVENDDDAQALRRLGCPVGQGFLFGKPMSAEAALNWLAQHYSEPRALLTR